MKIGLVRQRFLKHGGAERYMNAVALALAERGHEIHIFAHRWDSEGLPPNIICHRVPMIRFTSFLRALTFALNAKQAVERAKCDVVCSFERTLRQDIYRAGDGCHREYLIQRLRFSPKWKRVTIWLNPLHATMLWLERQTLSPRCTRLIIANSHQRKEEIIRHYSFPPDCIEVMHNVVDTEKFCPRPKQRKGGEFVLLFVGSGFRRKGLEYCVQALAKLPGNVRLKVVGKGKTRSYLKLARKLGVVERVEFAGTVTDMPAMYATGDLLVLPAIYEAFANVCLEAMACGLPVVTTRINGVSEIIQQGKNGAILEDPNDIDALAQLIEVFLDRSFYIEASGLARETAEQLTFARNVEKTLELIQLALPDSERGEVQRAI